MRMGSSDGDAAVPGGVRPFLASALAGLGPHVIHDERDAPRPVGNGAWGHQTVVSIPVTAEATKRYLSLVVTHRGFPHGTRSAVSDTLTWSLPGAGAALGGTVKASDVHHAWLNSMAGGRTLGGARPFWVIPLGFVAEGGATAEVTVTTASERGEWVVAAVLTDHSQALAGVGGRFVAANAGVPENHVRINDRPAAIPFDRRPQMSGDNTPSGAAEGFDRDGDFSPDLEEQAAGTNPLDKRSAPVVLSSLISRRLTQRYRPNPHGWIGFQDLTENIGWALFEPSTASAVGIPLLGLTYQTYLIPGTQFETGYLSEAQYLGAPRGHADDFVSLWGKQGKKPTVERGLPEDDFGREVFDPAWDVDAAMALYVPEPQRKLFERVPYWPEFIATIGKRYRLRGPLSEANQSRTFLKVRWEKTWPSYEAYISDVSKSGWAWWPGHSPNTATLGDPVSMKTKTLTIPKGENYSEPEDIVPKLSEGDLPEGQFSDGKPRVVVERLLPVELTAHKRGTIDAPGASIARPGGSEVYEVVTMENADYDETDWQPTSMSDGAQEDKQDGKTDAVSKDKDDDFVKLRFSCPLTNVAGSSEIVFDKAGTGERMQDADIRFYNSAGERVQRSALKISDLKSPSGPLAPAFAGGLDLFVEIGDLEKTTTAQGSAESTTRKYADLIWKITTGGTTIERKVRIYRGGFWRNDRTDNSGTIALYDGKGRKPDGTIDYGQIVKGPYQIKTGQSGITDETKKGGPTPRGWYGIWDRNPNDNDDGMRTFWDRDSNPPARPQTNHDRNSSGNYLGFVQQGSYCQWSQAGNHNIEGKGAYGYDNGNDSDPYQGMPASIHFKFELNPIGSFTSRTYLQIHPDGFCDGTLGCVGIQAYDDCTKVLYLVRHYFQTRLLVD
jgi:hypothetical protein